MNYNEVISKLREIARDGLRLKLVSNVRTEANSLDNRKIEVNKEIENANLRIAVIDFETSEIKANDPEKDAKAKELENDKDFWLEKITKYQERLAELDKQISAEMDHIAKIQAGEVKVSKESLEDETNRLIKVVTEEVAKAVKA